MRSVAWAGGLLGFGLSGLVDIAVFHLLLQWHHFVTAADEATRLRADGWLMLALLAATLAGALLLWRAARAADEDEPAARVAWGGALLGAGAFNGGDVLLDHFVLGLHRLREDSESLAPDVAWLGVSALALVAGAWLVRGARRRSKAPARRPARS